MKQYCNRKSLQKYEERRPGPYWLQEFKKLPPTDFFLLLFFFCAIFCAFFMFRTSHRSNDSPLSQITSTQLQLQLQSQITSTQLQLQSRFFVSIAVHIITVAIIAPLIALHKFSFFRSCRR